jgi:hypothetical protein
MLTKRSKNRHETTVIIGGLVPKDTTPDSQLVTDLCTTEFHFVMNTVSAKRLGHLQKDKIQLLLVYKKEVEQAKQLFAHVKQLRRSSDLVTR